MSVETDPVTVRIGDVVREGRVIDCRGMDVDASAIANAIRESGRPDEGQTEEATERRLQVDCPRPGPAYEYVGHVRPSVTLRVRTALADAARSRGLGAPQDHQIQAVRDRLAELDRPEPPNLAAARRRIAGTSSSVDRLRERVATLRGRIQAGREAGREVDDLEAALADATRELSEQETERAAARETLERARRRARESRDARERRRRLEDRLANLERAARAHLVDAVRTEYEAAVAAARRRGIAGAPSATSDRNDSPDATDSDPFETDDPTAMLAVARVADLSAPVVLACDRFESPATASRWFDAPVVRT